MRSPSQPGADDDAALRAAQARTQVHALIAAEPVPDGAMAGTAGSLQSLCRAAVRALPAAGTSLALTSPQGSSSVVAASDEKSQRVGELCHTLGEGPFRDALATGQPVLVADLDDGPANRWPLYSEAVSALDIRAVFALPLQVGAARLGALEVYRVAPGPLSKQALAQALTFAEVATTTVLDGQQEVGQWQVPSGLDDALGSQFAVHQAQGMVMVQLGVSLGEALARMRAHAFTNDRRLVDLARDIVERRLVLERDQP
jgi:hypothetical protein